MIYCRQRKLFINGFPSKFKKLRCDLDGRGTSRCAMPYPLYRDFVKCIYKDSDNYDNMFVMYNTCMQNILQRKCIICMI